MPLPKTAQQDSLKSGVRAFFGEVASDLTDGLLEWDVRVFSTAAGNVFGGLKGLFTAGANGSGLHFPVDEGGAHSTIFRGGFGNPLAFGRG